MQKLISFFVFFLFFCFSKAFDKNGLRSWAAYDPQLLVECDMERITMDRIYQTLKENGHPVNKWYFCIIDIVQILTESKDYHTARKYWNKLKQRLVSEGNETVTNCHQLRLRAADGKLRYSDVADLEQMLRLVQSGELA